MKLRIGEEEYNKQFDKLPALLTTPSGTFSFTPKDSTTVQSTQEIMLRFLPPQCGKRLPGSIEHRAYFQIHHYRTDLCQEHASQRGMDSSTSWWKSTTGMPMMTKRSGYQDRGIIDERIKIINGELGTTEQELETFKRDAGSPT